jgi:hypothetical protein
MLDRADAAAKSVKTRKQRQALSKQVRNIWSRALPYEGVGEFEKVLKRVYRLAGFAGLRLLRRRAQRDILANPGMVDRVCNYMRCSGTVSEYLIWTEQLMNSDEQIYPDINVTVMESFLRLEADQAQSRNVRRVAVGLLLGRIKIPGAPECKALAPLLILRFGDKRTLPLLKKCFDDDTSAVSAHLLRAAAVVYSSFGNTEFGAVRRSASRRLLNHLAEVVKLVERIRKYTEVPVRYKARLETRYDSVAQTKYVDMRALLTVRLLHLATKPKVTSWIAQWKTKTLSERISAYDRRLVERLI